MGNSIVPPAILRRERSGRGEGVNSAVTLHLFSDGLLYLGVAEMVSLDRICPGKYFALRTLFLNVACTLAVFNIEPPTGEKVEAKFYDDGATR